MSRMGNESVHRHEPQTSVGPQLVPKMCELRYSSKFALGDRNGFGRGWRLHLTRHITRWRLAKPHRAETHSQAHHKLVHTKNVFSPP